MSYDDIGYWDEEEHRIENAIDVEWKIKNGQLYDQVLDYLTSNYLESYEMGYSYCHVNRNCPYITESKDMGCCNLTDGKYRWPEGYRHYLQYHQVKPPNAFIEHIIRQETRSKENHRVLQWDATLQKAVPLPMTMERLLKEYTTLYDKKDETMGRSK